MTFETFYDKSMDYRMFAIRDNNGNILQVSENNLVLAGSACYEDRSARYSPGRLECAPGHARKVPVAKLQRTLAIPDLSAHFRDSRFFC